MESILRTEGLERKFKSGSGTIYALRNVNVNITPTSLTILRGRSGSGKTTLMNLMSALDDPTAGDVFFKDVSIVKAGEYKRDLFRRKNIGYVFQSVALISSMSAYENVEFLLRVSGYPTKDRRARAEECLKFVGLGKRMTHRPSELSGGEQQRVAIARAIAHRPAVVFADEPTAELDTQMGIQIVSLFRELVQKEGITIVMTTHDPYMVELADHVYTLSDGEIVEELWNERKEVGAL